MAWFQQCLFLVLACSTSFAFHTGAPENACDTMKPGHPFSPQTGKSPFRIIIAKKDVTAGEPVEMTLSAATSGPPFKGFLVQVHKKGEDSPVGEFDPASDDANAQPVNCGGNKNSAMTHKDLTTKTQVKLSWTPPGEGEYIPVVTWVQQLDTFWVKETADGATIKVTGKGGKDGKDGPSKTPGDAAKDAKPKEEVANNEVKRDENSDVQNQAAVKTLPSWSGVVAIVATLFMHKLF